MAYEEKIARLRGELNDLRDRDFGFIRAGRPRYDRLFGRDSLIVAWQRLELEPRIAVDTLRVLASMQGRVNDPVNEEAPGKILHEWSPTKVPWVRWTFPYFGSVDATPLFVLVACWTVRRTKDDKLAAEFWPWVRRACGWMTAAMAADRHGFLSYAPTNPLGLKHEGWKDSWDLGPAWPTAMVEVQGYAYASLLAAAVLARGRDAKLAAAWRRRAGELRREFNRRFWLKEKKTCALAVHGGGQVYPAVTSNPGHLLFTGILDGKRVPAQVRRLFEKDLFTPFGLRTLSSSERDFQADAYHKGSVWPHDNWVISEGLRVLGYKKERRLIKEALLAADTALGRLPELFAVSRAGAVAAIPNAQYPQAWASGALLNLLDSSLSARTALRIGPSSGRG